MTTTDHTTALAAGLAAGLRQLAALLTEHPHLADSMRYTLDRLAAPAGHCAEGARSRIVAFARAGRAAGATVTEHGNDRWAGVDVALGPVISLHVYADAETVHGAALRSVEEVEGGTRRIIEYTPRSILAELDGTS